jgi:phosphopantothenoylcysteine decarboxylase/phosphopantothenate--cysteine ligase
MRDAVMQRLDGCDVLVMSAAVADYRPAQVSPHKIKKSDDAGEIRLERTADILAEAGRRRTGPHPVLVGFAAETNDVEAYATRKLEEKRVDLIVANDVSRADAGFGVDSNAVTFVAPGGIERLPLQSKRRVAAAILDRVERLVSALPVSLSADTAQGRSG